MGPSVEDEEAVESGWKRRGVPLGDLRGREGTFCVMCALLLLLILERVIPLCMRDC